MDFLLQKNVFSPPFPAKKLLDWEKSPPFSDEFSRENSPNGCSRIPKSPSTGAFALFAWPDSSNGSHCLHGILPSRTVCRLAHTEMNPCQAREMLCLEVLPLSVQCETPLKVAAIRGQPTPHRGKLHQKAHCRTRKTAIFLPAKKPQALTSTGSAPARNTGLRHMTARARMSSPIKINAGRICPRLRRLLQE